jgi:hypothetical protein
MSRQGAVIVGMMVLGATCVAVWSARAWDTGISAAFWFEDVTGDQTIGFTREWGGPISRTELEHIQSIALAELAGAFSHTRLVVRTSPPAKYQVRVVAQLGAGLRATLPVAGASRPLPGRRGVGAVSFPVIASSAMAYAPADATRQTIIEAIGRGLGRSAAHELAHQVLREFPLDTSVDRRSYEFADLRPEHFYGEVHWTIAARPLEDLIGRTAASDVPVAHTNRTQ